MMMHIAKVSRSNLPQSSCERQHGGQAPFYLVALAFLTALGMLTFSLFWPFLLKSAITTTQTESPHSGLTFMFVGAGAFVFSLLLRYAVIKHAWLSGKPRVLSLASNVRPISPSTRNSGGHYAIGLCSARGRRHLLSILSAKQRLSGKKNGHE